MVRLAVCDYGMGNLRSVSKALEHVGADAYLVTRPEEVGEPDGVVLPGVGAFGRCLENLRATGLDSLVREWVTGGRPFLGICLGLQMLFEDSDEGGGPGLGLLPGRSVRVGAAGLPVPHMGWDQVTWERGSRLFEGLDPSTHFYFVHSYGVPAGRTDVAEAECEYGVSFIAAVERGRVFATQFHPEKSSGAGLRVLHNFVAAAER